VFFVVLSLPFRFRSTSPGICDDTYYAGACHPNKNRSGPSCFSTCVILEGSSCCKAVSWRRERTIIFKFVRGRDHASKIGSLRRFWCIITLDTFNYHSHLPTHHHRTCCRRDPTVATTTIKKEDRLLIIFFHRVSTSVLL
jgi:hypothetical protein